ncbi:MAG: secretin and TonB N-terminal domain-containing protein, partial [Armatimonadota bacterium]
MQKDRSLNIKQKLYSIKKSELIPLIVLIISFLFMLLCVCRPAFSQVTAEKGAITTHSAKGVYDVDASGTDIKIVLEALARRSGANIVVSPDITGNITIHLKKMPLEQILDNLSKVHGFVWEKKDNTYIIATKEMLYPNGMNQSEEIPEDIVLIFEFKYVDPADAEKVINQMFPELKTSVGPAPLRPQLSTDKTALSFIADASALSTSPQSQEKNKIKLVVMGKEELVKKAEKVLENLDKPRPQIKIDVSI